MYTLLKWVIPAITSAASIAVAMAVFQGWHGPWAAGTIMCVCLLEYFGGLIRGLMEN